MVFLFRNVVCRHSVATTQFTFTSYCNAYFVYLSRVRDAMQSHIRKQQILFHRQFEDKQEFEKETNKSFIFLWIFHTHIFEILFASVFIPFYTVYEYHLSLSLFLFSFFFYFSFPFSFGKKSAKRRCR